MSYRKVYQHDYAEDYAIVTENLEIVFFYIAHQEFDAGERYGECRGGGNEEYQKLAARKVQTEFYEL